MKTYMAKAQTVERKWYVIDAAGVPLGRLASRVASVLRGKNKPVFTPNIGGLKEISYKRMLEEKSDLAVYEAVRGMLPKNSLGRATLKKLRVYKGAEHNHAAQKPEVLTVE